MRVKPHRGVKLIRKKKKREAKCDKRRVIGVPRLVRADNAREARIRPRLGRERAVTTVAPMQNALETPEPRPFPKQSTDENELVLIYIV